MAKQPPQDPQNWYLARIELHGVPEGHEESMTAYDGLHKAMRKKGFFRVMKFKGKVCHLPDATYIRVEKPTDTSTAVQQDVLTAVKEAGYEGSASILITPPMLGDDVVAFGLQAAPEGDPDKP